MQYHRSSESTNRRIIVNEAPTTNGTISERDRNNALMITHQTKQIRQLEIDRDSWRLTAKTFARATASSIQHWKDCYPALLELKHVEEIVSLPREANKMADRVRARLLLAT